jgi:hypothetical protein
VENWSAKPAIVLALLITATMAAGTSIRSLQASGATPGPMPLSPATRTHPDPARPPEEEAARTAVDDYRTALFDDMRRSPDPHTQAWGLVAAQLFEPVADSTREPPITPISRALSDLVSKYSDDLLVQWTIAGALGKAADEAIANVQRLEGDNAASWAFSLNWARPNPVPLIRKMAACRRYDEHNAEQLKPWLAAMQKRPPPPAAVRKPTPLMTSLLQTIDLPATATDEGFAVMMSRSTMNGNSLNLLSRACERRLLADASLRDACVATGRLMLNSKQSLGVSAVGAAMLSSADALGPNELDLARHIYWWRQEMNRLRIGGNFQAYLSDYLSSNSEVQAFQRAADRAGLDGPPEGWKSPLEMPISGLLQPGDEN